MPLKGKKLKKEIKRQQAASKIIRAGGGRTRAEAMKVFSAKERAQKRIASKYR